MGTKWSHTILQFRISTKSASKITSSMFQKHESAVFNQLTFVNCNKSVIHEFKIFENINKMHCCLYWALRFDVLRRWVEGGVSNNIYCQYYHIMALASNIYRVGFSGHHRVFHVSSCQRRSRIYILPSRTIHGALRHGLCTNVWAWKNQICNIIDSFKGCAIHVFFLWFIQ